MLQGVLQTVRPTFATNATADNGGNVHTSDVVMQSSRSAEAINEITDNDTALYGVFWYEFFLNKGLGSGSVNVASRRHMLLQYTGRFARNQEFILLLANKTQRHAYARAVSARVKSNERAIDGFVELIHDDTFIPDLEKELRTHAGRQLLKCYAAFNRYWFHVRARRFHFLL
jgi:hypothetical protein